MSTTPWENIDAAQADTDAAGLFQSPRRSRPDSSSPPPGGSSPPDLPWRDSPIAGVGLWPTSELGGATRA